MMQLRSSAFENNSPILSKYTCDDPDAANDDWVHWGIYNILREIDSLPENIATLEIVDIASVPLTQGINSWPRRS